MLPVVCRRPWLTCRGRQQKNELAFAGWMLMPIGIVIGCGATHSSDAVASFHVCMGVGQVGVLLAGAEKPACERLKWTEMTKRNGTRAPSILKRGCAASVAR